MTTWQPQYCIGNAEIDRQHEHIFDLARVIKLAVTSEESDQTLDILLDHLVRYMRLHFRAEERLMVIVGYPGLRFHQMEHEQCSLELDRLMDSIHRGTLDRNALPAFVQTWILSHLTTADKAIMPYVAQAQEAAELWAQTARKETTENRAIH